MVSSTPSREPGRRLRLATVLLVLAGAVVAGTHGGDAARAGTSQQSEDLALLAQLDTGGTGNDVAFWGDLAVVGLGDGEDGDVTDDGFLLVDVSDPKRPLELSRVLCPGGGYDVAVWEDLVFVAGQDPVEDTGCGGDARPVDEPFAGVRIVSIKDRAHPKVIAAVDTNKGPRIGERPDDVTTGFGHGAHTFSLLPQLDHKRDGRPAPRLLVYTNGIAPSDVIEVPLHDPARARVVGAVRTLPGSLGCHDLSFFVPRKLALCAGITESQIWDMRDPLNPEVLSHIVNPLIHHNHSAAFSWDGNTVVIAEENIENVFTDRCAGGGPVVGGRQVSAPQGALWFYDVSVPRAPVPLSHFQLPYPSSRYCSAHQMNVVPLPDGRDVVVAGWYTGGTVVVDFTDRLSPRMVGSFQGDPDRDATRSNAWSSYWYDGHVYSTNFTGTLKDPTGRPLLDLRSRRGLEVLEPKGELKRVLREAVPLHRFNFGLQEAVPGVTD